MAAADTGQTSWPATTRLSAEDVGRLDPYAFLAVLGKRVIHPGGRRSTEELLDLAGFAAGQQVLDIGCGSPPPPSSSPAASTLTSPPPTSPRSCSAAPRPTSPAPGSTGRSRWSKPTSSRCPTPTAPSTGSSPRQSPCSSTGPAPPPSCSESAGQAAECSPPSSAGFCWRRPPTAQARQVFLGEVCPGLQVDTIQEWTSLYHAAGLDHIQVTAGPFEMMTMRGFLADEGPSHALAVVARGMSRPSYLAKMGWLMPRMHGAVAYLGYVVIAGTKQPGTQPQERRL